MQRLYRYITLLIVLVRIPCGAQAPLRERIERAVEQAVITLAHTAGEDSVAVEFRTAPAIPVSVPEDVDVRVVETPGKKAKNHCTVVAELMRAGRVVHRLPVSVLVRTFGAVLTASRQIDRWISPAEADVTMRFVETTAMTGARVLRVADLSGKRSARIITAGSVLVETMFEQMPVIVPGKHVQLRIRAGRVVLSSDAVAKDAGGEGAVISVQPAGSREKVRATVVDDHTVELAVD